MDVRCGRCGTEYEFDDALISQRGTTVQCTQCGFQFKIYPEGSSVEQECWVVISGSGAGWRREYTSLKDLQLAIQRGEIGPMDLLTRGTSAPRPLRSIAELEPLFHSHHTDWRSGTLLGVLPHQQFPLPDADPPPTEAMPAKRRVETKLGLPPPAVSEIPPGAPPPTLSSSPGASSSESAGHAGPEKQASFTRTLLSVTSYPPPAEGDTPQAETPPGPADPPRQRIMSALSGAEQFGAADSSEGEAPSPPRPPESAAEGGMRDEHDAPFPQRHWAHQTLHSVPHRSPIEPRPVVEVARSSEPPRRSLAEVTLASYAPPAVEALQEQPLAPVPPASRVQELKRQEDRESEVEEAIVLPKRAGLNRWAIGALSVTAAAGLLWLGAYLGARSSERAVSGSVAVAPPAIVQAPATPEPAPVAPEQPDLEAGEGELVSPPTTSAQDTDAQAEPPWDAPEAPSGGERLAEPSPAAKGPTEPSLGDFRARLLSAARADRAGDLSRAEELYRSVLDEQPGNIEARAGLAEVAQRQGDTRRSSELYDQVLASNPSYVPALMGRADQYWVQGDRKSALPLYQRVVDQVGASGPYGQRARSRIEQARAEQVTPPAGASSEKTDASRGASLQETTDGNE